MGKKQSSSTSKDQALKALGQLTLGELRGLLRPRAGFTAFTKPLVALARVVPEIKAIKGLDLDAVIEDLNAYEALGSEIAAAKQTLLTALQARLVRASNIWRAMLTIYRRARAIGATDENVLHAIASFEVFMKTPRKKKAAPVPTTP